MKKFALFAPVFLLVSLLLFQAAPAATAGARPELRLESRLDSGRALGPAPSQAKPQTMPLAKQQGPRLRRLGLWDGDAAGPGVEKAFAGHAEPNSPQGGRLRLGVTGSFDSFNPFSARGLSASYLTLVFESLGEQDPGQDFVMYPQLAESFELPADRSHLIAHLHPLARFHDGSPVLAEDVVFTFNALINQASPFYRSYYGQVAKVEAISERSVKFTFTEANNRELPLIVCQLPVLSKKWWQGKSLGDPLREPLLGSGPYRVAEVKSGSSLVYEKVADWWAKDLPQNRGRYNFGSVQVDYYRDTGIMREAFLAGELDVFEEFTIKDWVKSYDVPPVRDGRILRQAVEVHRNAGMSGMIMNTRNPHLAQRKVREALTLLFDFNWTNRAIFYGLYHRCDSFFTNSPFAAPEYPGPGELAVLEKDRGLLDPEIFGPLPKLPETDGSGNARANLRKALYLLREAGWELKDGVLRNGQGQPLLLNMLITAPTFQRIVMPFRKNLALVGISLDVQLVDSTQYVNRVRNFDYDLILVALRQSESPGNEQHGYWGSAARDIPGSRNYAGVSDPVIDRVIEELIASNSRAELTDRTRALDRLLLHGRYVINGWYSKEERVAWWKGRVSPPGQAPNWLHPEGGVDFMFWHSVRAGSGAASGATGSGPAGPSSSFGQADAASGSGAASGPGLQEGGN